MGTRRARHELVASTTHMRSLCLSPRFPSTLFDDVVRQMLLLLRIETLVRPKPFRILKREASLFVILNFGIGVRRVSQYIGDIGKVQLNKSEHINFKKKLVHDIHSHAVPLI